MKNDPRELIAKFDSVCPETGKAIKKGDLCVYYPTARKAYHVESAQAKSFYDWQQDIAIGWDY